MVKEELKTKKHKLTSIYSNFLNQRNREILELRKQGRSLKSLANQFNLSIRQISRIINKMSSREGNDSQ